MGKLKGFLEFERAKEATKPVRERLTNYNEFTIAPTESELKKQGARCMSCGVPFCHSGCPLGNKIPDFNEAVFKERWQDALEILHSTNNFPEFTGRLCPAPCESACVLGIIKPPIAIELIEKNIVEKGFEQGWIKPEPPTFRTGKKVAVIGSGPAGLAAAQQLNRVGHSVTVFERDAQPGGLLRYGIPNFKLDKTIIDRRIQILEQEGIVFKTNTHVGVDYPIENLKTFDVVLLCGGATHARGLPIKGSDALGVMQAMEFLKHQNKAIEDGSVPSKTYSAKDKHVIVIGGGDTGSDCIGTSNRQGARSVTNFELAPMPTEQRTSKNPWPFWPFTLKTSTSHEEGSERLFSILTKAFVADANGKLKALKTVNVKWDKGNLVEVEGTEKEWPCDLALLALGFTGPEKTLSEKLGLALDARSNIHTNGHYQTALPAVFSAGDMRRGQSLIVWAISEGREAAYAVDKFLAGKSKLPTKEKGDLPAA